MQRINALDLDKVVDENAVAYLLLYTSSDDHIVVCVFHSVLCFSITKAA